MAMPSSLRVGKHRVGLDVEAKRSACGRKSKVAAKAVVVGSLRGYKALMR